MGNCFRKLEKSKSEITPHDFINKGAPVVKLYGSPDNPVTCYIRFALQYKPISLHLIDSVSEVPVIRFESDVVSGSVETMLRYMDAKFPEPPLTRGVVGVRCDKTTPLIAWLTVLQHRSLKWHLERLVRWSEDLAARGGRTKGDPAMGTPQMEVRKFSRSYSQLLELMLEHAQMEERIIFPIFQLVDSGLCKVANNEHARDLPIMNGIKEDIKSVVVLGSANPDYQDVLFNLSARLKALRENSEKHFDEEERHILPLIEAAELSEQGERELERCLDAMPGTHSHLLRYFMEGLLPLDAIQYLDLTIRCCDKQRLSSMLRMILD